MTARVVHFIKEVKLLSEHWRWEWSILLRKLSYHTKAKNDGASCLHFSKEVDPGLAKPPLNFNNRLANLGLISLVK